MRPGFLHFLFPLFLLSQARDSITSTQFLRDGETIISSGGHFEMGFFSSPAGSINRYVGIWYNQISVQIVIWIANRETALTSSAVLKIVQPGRLVLIDGSNNSTIWSTNASKSVQNPVAQLLDSGNLVVRDADDESPENFIWQSFDYPTDTYFPGMKLGWNFETGHEVYITARKTDDDPASGQFTLHLDPSGYPQIVIKNGSKEIYKTGPWNGLQLSGTLGINPDNPHYKFEVYMSPTEVYARYDVFNNWIISTSVLTSSGVLECNPWVKQAQSLASYIKYPSDVCDSYGICGANGICSMANSPVCGCLEKFTKNNSTEGEWVDWSDGCQRRKPLKCKNGTDGFNKYSGIKLPDTKNSWFNTTMNLKECEVTCLKNCSCTAYSSLDIRNGGSGCLLWFNDLINIRAMSLNGQDIYIRLDSSEISETITTEGLHPRIPSSKGKKVKIIFGCLLPLTSMVLLGLSLGLYFYKKSKKEMKVKEWLDLPLFNLPTILRATNNFSNNNKLGEGGFGTVYKKNSQARDTITSTQFLRDGETLISSGGSFEMGFFSSPAGSINRYIGIWYKQIPVPTVVWIANRETVLTNTKSAVLKIIKPGRLVLSDGNNVIIWSSNTSRSANNPIAQLLDSGNLVLRDAEDENPENFLWQSFDYPTDTVLQGMKLGWNFVTGHEVYATARKSENDPSSGQFTLHYDPTGYPQGVIKNGSQKRFVTGPWNGLRWSGMPELAPDARQYKYQVSTNPREVYARYDILNNSIVLRLVLTSSGDLQFLAWVHEVQSWISYIKTPRDVCDIYAICGANGICNMANSPVCGCFEKFTNNNRRGLNNWSDGCHRRKPLKCENGTDGFKKYSGIKLPDTSYSWFNRTMSLKDCEHQCLKNCSCTAYSSLDISKGGSGCLLWFNDLIDIRVLSENGQDIYIRLDSSEIPGGPHSSSKGKKVKIIIGSLVLGFTTMTLLGLSLGLYFYKKSKKEVKLKEWLELPLFDLSTISKATNNFSYNNKVGEGGFGAVYRRYPPMATVGPVIPSSSGICLYHIPTYRFMEPAGMLRNPISNLPPDEMMVSPSLRN
nr:G-type lectin S-receptor-like serine/threonine-protein kinase At4g27290 [Ipomoea batatas]